MIMFRKIAHIVIVMLLLVSTGGIPVTRHFCGKVQKSVSIYTTLKPCCGGHCDKCRNIFSFTRLNDEFVSGSYVSTPALSEIIVMHAAVFTVAPSFSYINSVSEIKFHRADFIFRAGCTPAALGNFRC